MENGAKTEPVLGILEWFRPGEQDRVEQVLSDLRRIGVHELRTGISWADYHAGGGAEWYDWLLPRLAAEVNVLPCFTYTPPSLGIEPKTSSPPRDPKAFADFLDLMITSHGDCFEWVELWNEPNNLNDWDWRMDPDWEIFAEMITMAGFWCHERGKKTVLGGMCPTEPNWIDLMCRRGVMQYIDAVGVHGFPGTWEYDWDVWSEPISKVRTVLDWHGFDTEIWITEGGYSVWQHDEFRQLCEFARFVEAPATRAYWYSARDLHPDLPHQDGFHQDERHYHFGMCRADGKPKMLFRVLSERGVEGVRKFASIVDRGNVTEAASQLTNGFADRTAARPLASSLANVRLERPVLITGGAGFIGTNVADAILSSGRSVRILDNLSRPGVEENVRWLMDVHGERVQVEIGDIRNPYVVRRAVRGVDRIFHFAAQVAVTTSVDDPVEDFDINVRGALNLLEAIRASAERPRLLFTSTNKVYGHLPDIELRELTTRYEPADRNIRQWGIDRARPLQFQSPYGCSKGAADQYVLDYASTFGLPTIVFRMSCIYGPHQCGTEDQGWVAHFLLQALGGNEITLYGDGKQVRDILFVEDLVEAMLVAMDNVDRLSGQAFNIGGGPANTVSLIELLRLIGTLNDGSPRVRYDQWRPGDQRYYVSDIRDFIGATRWQPSVGVQGGVARLYQWLTETRQPQDSRMVA